MKFRKKPLEIEAVQFTGNVWPIVEFTGGSARAKYGKVEIETLEGTMTASLNDWIIKGVEGEFYPCKPDIFEKTYEPVD